MNKSLKTLGLIIGPLVLVSAVVAGVMETRVNLMVVQDSVKNLDTVTQDHTGKVKVLERRADDTERRYEKQSDTLDDIKEYLNDLKTEQRVQGQLLKGFIEEYRRQP